MTIPVPFQQKGLLSPSKKAKPSPAKKKDEEAAPQATKPASLMDKLNQMDSKEVKAKIKTVNKLADLQAQLKSLKNDTNVKKAASQNNIKRALFQDDQKKVVKEEPKVPLMSPKKMPREAMAAASTLPKPVMSPGKASPRKSIPAFVRYQELAQPDKFLPLPNRYKALTEIFRSVDVIVSMKFNRKEMIRVPDLKPAVQNITRKNFSEFYLRQVWPPTDFFLLPFCEKSLICLEGKSMTPLRGNTIFFRSSQQLPRLRLGPSKGFLS